MSRIAFGPYHFETRTRLLYRGEEEVTLPPRAAALLGHLLDRAGELVTKEELLDLVWADARVSDTSLKEAIHVLRQALDDSAKRAVYVQTIPRRGYRFVASVRPAPEVISESQSSRWPSTGRIWSLAIAAAGLLAGLWLGSRGPTAPNLRPHRFTIDIPAEQNLGPGPANLALSPDGRYLVYAAKTAGSKWQLYLRPTNELAVRAIPGTEGGRAPFFSPDGKTLAFFTTEELRTMPFTGGAVRTICEVTQGLGGTWSNERIVFSTFESRDAVGLWWVPASGGRPRVLTIRGVDEIAHRWPEAIGDRFLLYTVWRSRLDEASLALLDLASGESKVILEGGGSARYLPGALVYARSSELLAVPFDTGRGTVTGPPVTMVRGVATTPVWGTAHFDISTSGSLVYMPTLPAPHHRLLRVDPTARQSRPENPPEDRREVIAEIERAVMDLRLAPDARRLLITTQGAALDLWTLELESGAIARLTDDGTSHAGVFSTDGDEVFYASRQQGKLGIYRRATTGGEPELVYPSATAVVPCAVTVSAPGGSATGDAVLIAEIDAEGGWDLMVLDPSGDARPFLTTPFDEKRAALSPDGKLVAYESNETGTSEVYLRRFPLGSARWPLSSGGGTHPLFSADGSEVFFRRGREIFAAPLDLRLPEPRIGSATRRFAGPDVAGYSMALDGEAVLLLDDSGAAAQEKTDLVYVVHFSTELRETTRQTKGREPANLAD